MVESSRKMFSVLLDCLLVHMKTTMLGFIKLKASAMEGQIQFYYGLSLLFINRALIFGIVFQFLSIDSYIVI